MSKSKESSKSGAQAWWNAAALTASVLASAFIGLGAYGKFDSPHPDKLVTLPSLGEVKLDLVVAACEVVIALALLFGHRLRAAWFCSTLLFGGLMGWVIFAMRTDMDCGCFGEFIKIEPEVSLTIDTVFFLASIGLLASHRRTGVVLPVIAVLLAGANSVVGYNFNKSTTTDAVARQTAALEAATEKAGNRSAAQLLLDSDLMKEVREREPGGKATYVFIYDPH